LRPTTTWKLGEQVEDNYGIAIPVTLPAGSYTLEIGMYDGARRSTFDGKNRSSGPGADPDPAVRSPSVASLSLALFNNNERVEKRIHPEKNENIQRKIGT